MKLSFADFSASRIKTHTLYITYLQSSDYPNFYDVHTMLLWQNFNSGMSLYTCLFVWILLCTEILCIWNLVNFFGFQIKFNQTRNLYSYTISVKTKAYVLK
jgi:hypothetical protein